MKDRLEIATLGGIALRRNGRPVVGLASRKVKALLIFLACTGKDQPRETLATLFWGGSPQDKAMASLRVALSNLKKNLGPFLTITRTTAGINPA